MNKMKCHEWKTLTSTKKKSNGVFHVALKNKILFS